MLAVASGLFGKSSSLSAYALHSSTPSVSPATSSTNLPATAGSTSKGFNVGLWKVVGATHKTTNKDVSVWMFEKKVLDSVRGASQTKEWVMEQLKKEVSHQLVSSSHCNSQNGLACSRALFTSLRRESLSGRDLRQRSGPCARLPFTDS